MITPPANFLVRALRWFDPRGRSLSTWAFILNRLTALGLTFYLFLHLMVLGQLAQGPGAYDQFLELTHSVVFKIGELLVVAAVIIHGLNGIRITLTSFGIAVPRQRELFIGILLLSLMITGYFAVIMFGS